MLVMLPAPDERETWPELGSKRAAGELVVELFRAGALYGHAHRGRHAGRGTLLTLIARLPSGIGCPRRRRPRSDGS